MPSDMVEKGSPRRRWFWLVVIVASLLTIGLMISWWCGRRRQCDVRLGNSCVQLERVSSAAALERGLSGRVSMPENQGMLFVFNQAGKRCFWMKDMRFPLDMIWLDAAKKVVTIRTDVAPETYPETFCSDSAAQYVVEVNAGVAAKAQVEVGDQLQF